MKSRLIHLRALLVVFVPALFATPNLGATEPGLQEGLLFHLPLQEDLRDHGPSNLPVAVTNSVELRGDGAWFSGRDTWLELPHVPIAHKPFSVAMWVKVTGGRPMYGLLSRQGGDQPNTWLHLMLRGGLQPYMGFYVNDAISPQPMPARKWVHLVFVHDGRWQMIWIDGKPLCARESGPYEGDGGVTRIGYSPRWTNVPSIDFEGYLKDVRMYGRVLTQGEIQSLSGLPAHQRRDDPDKALNPDASTFEVAGSAARDFGVPFISIKGKQIVITGESAQVYEVQATGDLSEPWRTMAVMTNSLGKLEIEDPAASDHRNRFYRIKFLESKQGDYWTW